MEATEQAADAGMPPRVRTWLDYELANAAYLAGRTAAEPGEYVSDPCVDDLCAALPHAADQLERVKILGQLCSAMYNSEDLIIGELYLAAQEFPERMDHMYDYVYAASSARKELGPDVVRWLEDLGEFGEGVDMDTAQVMVRALHMHQEWEELTADWQDVPALEQRTVWHDGHWRHQQDELVPLHRAEYEAVVGGRATPQQLAEWKAQPWVWPQPVKTDRDGPWVVAEVWEQFLRLKALDDRTLAGSADMAAAQAARLAEHLELARQREEKLQKEYDAASARAQRLHNERRARHGEVMRMLNPRQVELAVQLNAEQERP